MARTTSELVANVLGLDGPRLEIDQFIDMSSTFVDEELDVADGGLSAARLKDIETLLAAHYYSLRGGRGPLAAETISDASERYHNIFDSGLKATVYGQQAIELDTTGRLAEIAAQAAKPRKRARFRVI